MVWPSRPKIENIIAPGIVLALPPGEACQTALRYSNRGNESYVLVRAPTLPPAKPPAMPLAYTWSFAVAFSTSQACNIAPLVAKLLQPGFDAVNLIGNIPQNVPPRANHWIPEARAKRPGVEERIRPDTPPTRRPETPRLGVSREGIN